MATHSPRDFVRVNDLLLHARLEDGTRWPSPQDPQPQPVLLSVSLVHDTRRAAEVDCVKDNIDYDALSTLLLSKYSQSIAILPSLEALIDRIAETCFEATPAEELHIVAKKTKGAVDSAVGIESLRFKDGRSLSEDRYFIEGLQCSTIIGPQPLERKATLGLEATQFPGIGAFHTQCIDSVTVRAQKPNALIHAEAPEIEISQSLADYRQESESSVIDAETKSLLSPYSPHATLSGLLRQVAPELYTRSQVTHTVALGLGSNLGERFANIELALRLLETPDVLDPQTIPNLVDNPQISITDTSFMYETAPMYVADRPKFINCASLIETNLEPESLLAVLKKIEQAVGRVPSTLNGPKAVDLDILTYDSGVIDTKPAQAKGDLSNLEGHFILHPRIAEREFVLRPLADMIPDYKLPTSTKSIARLLKELEASSREDAAHMYKVIPFPRYAGSDTEPPTSSSSDGVKLPAVPATERSWKYPSTYSPGSKLGRSKTYIMAILNATPDSFSDGDTHNTPEAALKYAMSSVQAGMDILDIKGYSAKPNAPFVSPQEEIDRVLPAIRAVRSVNAGAADGNADDFENLRNALVSIDTFRPDVAEVAIRAGANCINDVYAFVGQEYPVKESSAEHFLRMRKLARNLAVPVVLVHSAGDSGNKKDYSDYDYAHDHKVLEGIRVELGEKVEAAVRGKGGLRRWMVIVDPGVAFSKSWEEDLAILRNYANIVSEYRGRRERNPLAGYPLLIGTSRKGVLGHVLEQPDRDGAHPGRQTTPGERDWATAAAVSSAVLQGAIAVRAHNVQGIAEVFRVADALWK
ncbi:Dihydropteroate synthase [Gloeophyllum trabeum ATCC 11539]|uniref:Dihydropteroate synthase n=1 Tax=Gloeophyllum trabeum (strain ATCC 11539 / FP-39264 / Madison 617) TaxID=670483 RepID=S7PW90_GLOTA|nr:Dihydropteroate synthase [Gloeophyllum trabeum ATCC 11539]EPQ51788.1 Dihydropteroate synthase [Gloeophyllum trabeum ATCC 11539]